MPPVETPTSGRPNPEHVTALDKWMIGIASVNVALLFFGQTALAFLPPRIGAWLLGAELVFIAIYAIEFIARIAKAPAKMAYAKSHWYDIVGAAPVADPIIRSLRLIRILRVWIFSKPENLASDKGFGELAVKALLERFMTIIVTTIINPLIVIGIGITKPIMTRIRFAELIGQTIDHTNEDIRELVRANMKRAPGIGRVLSVGPVDRTLKAAEDAAVHAVVATLKSEELNKLIQQTTGVVLDAVKDGMTATTSAMAKSS